MAGAVAVRKAASAGARMARERVEFEEWAKWRGQHVPLPGMKSCVEKVDRPMKDASGRLSAPKARITDTLAALHRNGTITDAMLATGRRFEEDFALAHFETVGSVDWLRVSSPGHWKGLSLTDSIQGARDRVWKTMQRLGGPNSPLGMAAWWVVGYGLTVKEFALRQSWSPGRPLDQRVATGLVVGALGLLG